MTIRNLGFYLFLYLTGVHFRGELHHGGDVSQIEIKCQPIRAREIGGVSLYVYLHQEKKQMSLVNIFCQRRLLVKVSN